MEVLHTSPQVIEEFHSKGLFGEFLCFSQDEYLMGDVKAVYSVELDDSDVIRARSLFYVDEADKLDAIVKKVIDACPIEIDEEEAQDLLDESSSYYDLISEKSESQDYESTAEFSWWLQLMTAQCAKALGYKACLMEDEQGAVYFVDVTQVQPTLKELR
ncbi:hypothetical protein [Pseudobacteriovorax antillogorgiicola]|uniref:Uncharacterized protein n=1 Tax=Pseudobacteriovorax antillogorgiicola TaxID=1513793 RepID=A0A1Y6CNV1_9BACT|nr:hypothetical protein [Pseudobacteriovorax antillogorgiicola]TCS44235.1 hypothetical protein EDD56_13435 [Pseudobacteriovorax antillogorgiicola]SMF80656.1 hypothetical protein SAMN06296036_13536 [Pseudobacteriovorax antillogorgiicola]